MILLHCLCGLSGIAISYHNVSGLSGQKAALMGLTEVVVSCVACWNVTGFPRGRRTVTSDDHHRACCADSHSLRREKKSTYGRTDMAEITLNVYTASHSFAFQQSVGPWRPSHAQLRPPATTTTTTTLLFAVRQHRTSFSF